MEQYQRQPDRIDKALGLGIVAFVGFMFGFLAYQIWGPTPQAAAATIAAIAAPSLFITSTRVLDRDGPALALLMAIGHVGVIAANLYVIISPYLS